MLAAQCHQCDLSQSPFHSDLPCMPCKQWNIQTHSQHPDTAMTQTRSNQQCHHPNWMSNDGDSGMGEQLTRCPCWISASSRQIACICGCNTRLLLLLLDEIISSRSETIPRSPIQVDTYSRDCGLPSIWKRSIFVLISWSTSTFTHAVHTKSYHQW